MTPQEIFETAQERAYEAARLAMIEHDQFAGECQAAWIIVRPARGPFVSYLKKIGHGDRGDYGGWEVDVKTPAELRGQNGEIKEAAVRAFAQVLKDNGIRASVHTRLV